MVSGDALMLLRTTLSYTVTFWSIVTRWVVKFSLWMNKRACLPVAPCHPSVLQVCGDANLKLFRHGYPFWQYNKEIEMSVGINI